MIDDKHLEIVADVLDLMESQARHPDPDALCDLLASYDRPVVECVAGAAIAITARLMSAAASSGNVSIDTFMAKLRKTVAS